MTEQRPLESFQDGWWGKTRWKDYLSTDFPDEAMCLSAGCVAIRNLPRREIMLTLTKSRYAEDKTRVGARWEIAGGHRDPLDPKLPDGPKEPLKQTVVRESIEEVGFEPTVLFPFGYRMIYNPPAEEQTGPRIYPEESYYAYYWAMTHKGLVLPTDPEKPLSGSFPTERLTELLDVGHMEKAEYNIVMAGVNACLDYHDISRL